MRRSWTSASSADAKNPTRYAVYAATGGLSLPDRDYYLDAKFAEKKAAYEAYVAQMLTMVGWDKPAEHAKAMVAFETRLAEASAGPAPSAATATRPTIP